MRLSKRAFSKKFNIEIQWVDSLCNYGYLQYLKSGNKITIDEKSFYAMEEGKHYVTCPECSKKMASLQNKHIQVCCPEKNIEKKYSEIYLSHKNKTEAQKKRQSETLKKRFKTKEGLETKKVIAMNSRRINSDPEFLKRKSETSKIIQNLPENKLIRSIKSRQMWSVESFRDKRKKEISENIDKYRKSAANARKYHKKTSKLHEAYKVSMIEKQLKGFISEYKFDFYSIDEADPFAKIAIEIDGCYWHGCSSCGFKGDQRIKDIDKRKETYLKNRGWVIFHIKEHEIKINPYAGIEAVRNIQRIRRENFSNKIKLSFQQGALYIQSLDKNSGDVSWEPINKVFKHRTPHKKIVEIKTEGPSICVTEDHSLFSFEAKKEVRPNEIKEGYKIIGKNHKDDICPLEVVSVNEKESRLNTYDVSVPGNESFFTASGVLAHNSYSISGVSLDIDKSSKYQSLKDSFEQEFDKALELAKRSIKIAVGLRQPRYGVGISSALGPYSRPGVQSRRNWAGGGRGGWV